MDLPIVELTAQQLVLIGQMHGRVVTFSEFDLLFPGLKSGIENENLAYCFYNSWASLCFEGILFRATVEAIESSYQEALTEILQGYYKEGNEMALFGEELEMYVASKMPTAINMFEDWESEVVQ